MQLKRYLTILSLALIIPISACTTMETVTKAEKVETPVVAQSRPEKINLRDVRFYVVNEKTLPEFVTRFKSDNPELVFIAISVPGYENLSANVAEFKRYIDQQNSLIDYYESLLIKEDL